MLFNSFEFAILVLLVFPAWRVLPQRGRTALLLGASYVFYGWWDWRFLPLLFASTATDFLVARQLDRSEDATRRRALLLVSCGVNLGLLAFFKYAGLFVSTANGFGHALGIEAALLPELQIVLPVGISFYTFQTLGYTIDVYRRDQIPCRSLLDFALYVGFFPQLVAGPIERAGRLLPQLQAERRVGLADAERAAFLFASGWFRKSLGDVFGTIADPVFADPYGQSAWALLWGLYAFSFQIYLDFSGYTDMARGTARLFGIELMENFRAPYFANNVQDFWRRWHISLSTWLRDYLYIPLGGSRSGAAATARNLLITMVLGGLWHGAAWNFAAWGLAHGIFLVLRRASASVLPSRLREARSFPGRVVRVALTFHVIVFTWLLFRARPVGAAGALEVAFDYLLRLPALFVDAFAPPPFAFWLLGVVLAIDVLTERSGGSSWSRGWHWMARGGVIAALALLGFVLGSGETRAFIYFQF